MSTVVEKADGGPCCHGAADSQRQRVRLSELLAALPEGLRPSTPPVTDPLIAGVTDDSREARPSWLFVAIKGLSNDGHDYIGKALEAGAAAIACERAPAGPAPVPCLVLPQTRRALGLLLGRFHGLEEAFRTGRLRLLGVTGTNGKTTSAYLIQHILNTAGLRCGRITTIDRDTGAAAPLPSTTTTPPATQLFGDLAQAAANGCRAAAMEVSSHGLDQDRVAGLAFAAAVFTNLTGDHLDYHGDMDRYAAAKAKLFASLSADAWAVVNADDPHVPRMLADCPGRVLRYSLKDPDADVFGVITACDLNGLRMNVHAPDGMLRVRSQLVGRHNAQNILGCVGAALAVGVEPGAIAKAIASFTSAPGRLEPVGRDLGLPFRVLVDYAHTDDALINVLEALRPLTPGQLWAVFGCGGDRDQTKRPRMGKAAVELADRVIVTSDNPRTEEPNSIIQMIVAGIPRDGMAKVQVEADRARAIRLAVASAGADDIILLAGKGHEDYQIIGKQKYPFDDRLVAAEAMRRRAADR